MKLRALARQEVVGDDLAQERVPEGVAVVGLGDDEVAGDGLAQRGHERAALHPTDLAEQPVVDALADGQHAQDVLGRGVELLDADHERVAQRHRQRAAAVDAGREQLLGEERVALAAGVQTVDEAVVGRLAEDVLQRGGQLVAAQRLEGDAVDRRVALDLRQERPQWVAAMQLVEAVGQDHEDPLAAERAGEERDEGPGRGIGPVEILEHEDDRRLAAEAVEEGEHGLEEPALRRAVGPVVRRRRAGQPREEAGQLGAVARMQRVEGGMAVAGEAPQRRRQRGVGQLALAELDGVAGEDLRAGRLGPAQELADEARLADAGVTRHEGERRAA